LVLDDAADADAAGPGQRLPGCRKTAASLCATIARWMSMAHRDETAAGGFTYFARLDALTRRIRDILGCTVDVVTEPIRTERLKRAVEIVEDVLESAAAPVRRQA